jgi:putative MATE family efflux protein
MQLSAMADSGNGRFFTRKRLWQLIWPLMIEQLLSITLGIADIIMISSRGESAVSGISLVDTIFILINSLFAALATGGAVVCSQYIGSRNFEMASRTAKQLIYTVIIGAVAVMFVGFAGGEFLLGLIFGRISGDVMANARTYFWYMLLSLPSVALYNGCAALFRSQGNSRVSMFTALFANALHIGVNATLLFVFGFGVEGVAFSTFISRTVAAAILLVLLHNRKAARNVGVNPAVRLIDISGISKIRIEPALIKKILQIGIPNGLENSVFQIGKILVLTLIATFGTGAIAANAAANTISSFEVLPASSIGLALLTVVGQCIGAGRIEDAVYYTKRLLLVAYAAMAALNVPLLLCSKWIIGLYGLSPATSDLGWQMLMWHGLCGIVFWPSSFTLPHALRAAGDAKYTMAVSLVSMWVVRVGLSYVFAIGFGFGAVGVWIAMCCDWVVRDALFIWRFARGKWKRRRII